MQTFNQITNKLKHIIGSVKDKDVAIALGVKPTTFASMKRRNKIPHKAVLNYCHDNQVDANTVLLGENELDEPAVPESEGKVTIKYFRTFDDYELHLRRIKETI